MILSTCLAEQCASKQPAGRRSVTVCLSTSNNTMAVARRASMHTPDACRKGCAPSRFVPQPRADALSARQHNMWPDAQRLSHCTGRQVRPQCTRRAELKRRAVRRILHCMRRNPSRERMRPPPAVLRGVAAPRRRRVEGRVRRAGAACFRSHIALADRRRTIAHSKNGTGHAKRRPRRGPCRTAAVDAPRTFWGIAVTPRSAMQWHPTRLQASASLLERSKELPRFVIGML